MQRRTRVARERVKQKRKRYDQEWIELKCGDDVAMKQAVKASCAATTRTIESCQHAKRASRKEARFTRFEEVKINGAGRQRCPKQRGHHLSFRCLTERHR